MLFIIFLTSYSLDLSILEKKRFITRHLNILIQARINRMLMFSIWCLKVTLNNN